MLKGHIPIEFRFFATMSLCDPQYPSDIAQVEGKIESAADAAVDLVEWYFQQDWTDGLPVVPPTPDKGLPLVGDGSS